MVVCGYYYFPSQDFHLCTTELTSNLVNLLREITIIGLNLDSVKRTFRMLKDIEELSNKS